MPGGKSSCPQDTTTISMVEGVISGPPHHLAPLDRFRFILKVRVLREWNHPLSCLAPKWCPEPQYPFTSAFFVEISRSRTQEIAQAHHANELSITRRVVGR